MAWLVPEAYLPYGGKHIRVLDYTRTRLVWLHGGTGSLLVVDAGTALESPEDVMNGLVPEQLRYLDYLFALDMPCVVRVARGTEETPDRFSSYITVYAGVDVAAITKQRAAKGVLWKRPKEMWSFLNEGTRLKKPEGFGNHNYWVQGSTFWSLNGRIDTFGSEEERQINPLVRLCF